MATVLAQLVVNGLAMGLVYAILASGLVLILGIARILYLAYGVAYMLGAYVVWATMVPLKFPFFISLCLAVLSTAILGLISYRLIFQYVQWQLLATIVAAIGLMMMLGQAALLAFGTSSRGVPSVFPGMVNVGGVTISIEKLVLIVLTLIVMVGLYFLLQKTNIGRGMRAVSFRADVAALQGVSPSLVYLAAMGIGCGLAGFAGGIMAPVYAVSPEMGNIILTVLLVVMLGGMGSMLGAILGGLVLGMTLSFGYYFIGGGLAQILLFIVIGIIVFFRPGGLLGQVGEELPL